MLSTCPGCCHTVPIVPAPTRFSCAQSDTGAEMGTFLPSFSAARFETGLENARRQLVQPFSSTTRCTLQDHGSQPSSPTSNSWDRLWPGHSKVIEDVTFYYVPMPTRALLHTGTVSRNANSVSVPQPPSSMCDGTLKPGFWKLCHWSVPLMLRESLEVALLESSPALCNDCRAALPTPFVNNVMLKKVSSIPGSLCLYCTHSIITRVRYQDVRMYVELYW